MTKEERREIRLWLTEHTIKQWVKDGMTLDEAKAAWREMEQYGE